MKTSRYNLTFDCFGIPEPTVAWEYDVDDFGISYGPGLWPFLRQEYASDPKAGRMEIAHPRLAPDYDYSAGRNLYVLSYQVQQGDQHVGQFSFHTTGDKQGMGYYVAHADAEFDLATGKLLSLGCYPPHRKQAQEKARKLWRFIEKHRKLRDDGAKAPVTAYDKWTALCRQKAQALLQTMLAQKPRSLRQLIAEIGYYQGPVPLEEIVHEMVENAKLRRQGEMYQWVG